MIAQRGSSTGNHAVDKEIDRLYRFLSRLQTDGWSGSPTVVNTEIIYTSLGGVAVKVQNGSGELIPKGYALKPIGTSSVTIANENDFNIAGICYQSIAPYGFGYMVVIGWCNVYFNSNGATIGNYLRMSKTGDTVSTDTGKSNSTSMTSMDTFRFMGYCFETRIGEGLAKCCLKSK
jgi:hypothetical protein